MNQNLKPASLWARILPIVVSVTYLTCTVLLFAFGPWGWQPENPEYLYTFLACVHFALLAGFVFGVTRKAAGYRWRISVESLLGLSVAANLILFPFVCYSRSGSWWPDIVRGLTDPGGAYQTSLLLTETQPGLVLYLRIFISPILFLAFPLGLYYWARIGWGLRLGVVAVALSTVALMIAIGMRAYIADMIIIAPWLLLAGHVSGTSRIGPAGWFLVVVVGLAVIVGFFVYFAVSGVARAGTSVSTPVDPLSLERPDEDHFLLRATPDDWHPGILGATLYFAGGYYVLDKCLSKPWQPTWGVGHSRFLTRNFTRLTKWEGFAHRPYTAQVERDDGISAFMWFSTIYPAIASDVSFPGVVPVVFVVGLLFGLVWADCLRGNNPLAPAALAQMTMLVFWFPALNRVQDGDPLVAFWVVLVAWLYTRRRTRVEARQ